MPIARQIHGWARRCVAATTAGVVLLLAGVLTQTGIASPTPPPAAPTPAPTRASHVATPKELEAAKAQWMRSRHANTFDDGMGANTTCASCKSPRNWDPQAPAAKAAHDCSACKREPGRPRPELVDGVPVPREAWKSITCDICHLPVGSSYVTSLTYWNQATAQYEPVSNSTELCAKCHTEQHGFQVIYEQTASSAHKGWACTRCHGSHNSRVQCVDCHDPAQGRGTAAHAQHRLVDCATCHDAGGLPIWQDPYPDSRFFQVFMPQRFAHALRSWPSHNLQTAVDCRRCHHPQGTLQTLVATTVKCDNQACHPGGAVFFWCPIFQRDKAPK